MIEVIALLSSLGVITAKKPVYAGLFFLLTLLSLSALYLHLGAQFVAVMQILVYAGAILVIFMFVIILFQDAHREIAKSPPQSNKLLLWIAIAWLILAALFVTAHLPPLTFGKLPQDYGTVASLGKALYLDFFVPFELVAMIFLIALVGAVYIGKKEKAS